MSCPGSRGDPGRCAAPDTGPEPEAALDARDWEGGGRLHTGKGMSGWELASPSHWLV